MPFGAGDGRAVTWVLLLAATGVLGALVVPHHPEPAPPPAAPLVRGGLLAAIPEPLPAESATGSSSTGELTTVEPDPGAAAPAPVPVGVSGVPGVPLAAYQRAERTLVTTAPACRLRWPLLAALGLAESGHAGGGRVDPSGRTIGRLLGARLDGSPGLPRVPDTGGGSLDQDPTWDRAVGPMQLLPSVWRRYGADGDDDGRADPDDVFDAALTAGRFLCAGGADLADPERLAAAVLRYRQSPRYLAAVRSWSAEYARGMPSVPLLVALPRQPAPRPPVAPDRAVAALRPPTRAAPATRHAPPTQRRTVNRPTRPAPSARPTSTAAPVSHRPSAVDRGPTRPGPSDQPSTGQDPAVEDAGREDPPTTSASPRPSSTSVTPSSVPFPAKDVDQVSGQVN